MLILQIEGQPFVVAVKLDNRLRSTRERYIRDVREYLDPSVPIRWVELDVKSPNEYGPDDIAAMLSHDTQEEDGPGPPRWETV